MSIEMFSPPIEDHGPVPSEIGAMIETAAEDAVSNPGFVEYGRLSRRIVIGVDDEASPLLHDIAFQLSRRYLDEEPAPGSTVLVSKITNAAAYYDITKGIKAASAWHQDFVENERGFFFPPDNRSRLIVPSLIGPVCVRDSITLPYGVKIYETNSDNKPDKAIVLQSNSTVYGADGVLMKSEEGPVGGRIYDTPPDRVYVLPNMMVHKSPDTMPQGRVFFQLDALL